MASKGWEADDVVATVCAGMVERAGREAPPTAVAVASADPDMTQVLAPGRVVWLRPLPLPNQRSLHQVEVHTVRRRKSACPPHTHPRGEAGLVRCRLGLRVRFVVWEVTAVSADN